MGFGNPVVGGTALRIPAIQSPNFVTAVSGWIIRIDGSAEFANIIIRGATTGDTVIIGPGSGSQILIGYTGTTSHITFPMHSPAENTAAEIFARVQNPGSGTAELLDLNFQGPSITTHTDKITQTIGSSNTGATIPARVSWVLNGTTTMMFLDDVNGLAINEPTAIGTAVNEIPLSINAPSSPGVSLVVIKTGATTRAEMDATGVLTTYAANAFTTYTPTITGDGGATFSTLTGWYQRVGKMVFFTAYAVCNGAGSGAGNVTITAPSSIDRTTRQHVRAHTESMTAGNNGSSTALAFVSGSGATFDRIRNSTNASITGADLLNGCIITVEGWYREA